MRSKVFAQKLWIKIVDKTSFVPMSRTFNERACDNVAWLPFVVVPRVVADASEL